MIWYLVVFALYLGFLAWVSLKSLRNVESTSDFTTGGHRMGLLLGVGTTTATMISVASVMGVPGYLYSTGVAAIIGWVAGWFFGAALNPILSFKVRRPEVLARTFPEFVQMRYEPRQRKSVIRIIVAALMVAGYFMFVHLQVVGFGIVVSTITGIDYRIAVFAFLVFLLLTSIAGFWSVAFTDAVNTVLMVVGVILGAIVVLNAAGGWETIMNTLETTTAPAVEGEDEMPAGLLLAPLGTFGFGTLLAIFLANSLSGIASPHWVARMLAPRNVKTAMLQVMLSLFVMLMIFVPLVIIGLGAKTLIPSLPAGLTPDYIFPMVITEFAHPFVGAMTLIALAAAAVSTANSMLLHCATSLYYDIFRNSKPGEGASDKATRRRMLCVVWVLGIFAVISAIDPPMLLAMGFTYVYSAFGAAFFFVVLMGLYWKRMNRAGAYTNIALGISTFGILQATGVENPFLYALPVSLVGTLIAVKLTPEPPIEAVEPYFEVNATEKTKQAMHRVRGDSPEPSFPAYRKDHDQ